MTIFADLKLQYNTGGVGLRLIYWNVACFLLSLFFYNFQFGLFDFPSWLVLSSNASNLIYHPWTLLSYSFLHDGFMHLFFNMMVLNFANRLFSTYFSDKQLFGLYMLSASVAGCIFVFTYSLFTQNTNIVGASGAIMGILVAATTYNPLMEIQLFLIGSVKLWHVTFVIILLDLMQIRMDNSGGHIAHLAGSLFGFIYIKLLQNGIDLSRIVTSLLNVFEQFTSKKKSTPFKKVHKNYSKPTPKPTSRIVTKDKTQQQIDEILDKISQSGYDSLSNDEKSFLFKAGK